MKTTPTLIPGLRSPYEQVGGLVHFGRMLDKIRLHAEGKLPVDWVSAKGALNGLDGRTCRFLHIEYAALETEALKGRGDEEMLAWAHATGRKPSEEEVEIWNAFLSKMGSAERVRIRLEEVGLPTGSVLTMFDFIDLDEGRPPRFQ